MFNIADVIVILIVLVFGLLGYKKGFIKTAFGMASFFVAIVLAFSLYKPVIYTITMNTEIDEWIYNTIAGKVEEKDSINVENKSDDISIDEAIKNLPENMKEQLGLDEIKAQAKVAIAERVTEIALNIIAFISVYIIARVLLAILCFVLDKLMLLPVLKQLNEILGLIMGLLRGVFGIFIVFSVITFLSSVCNIEVTNLYISNSLIAKFLYENNFIIYLLS